MKKIITIAAGLFLNISQAGATIQHWGYCTQFETIHSCQQNYTNDYHQSAYCSCTGEAPSAPIPYPGRCLGNPNSCL